LNPVLYSLVPEHADIVNDITIGENDGCSPSEDGFPAAEGWDAATGWGSPNYSKFAKVIDALP